MTQTVYRTVAVWLVGGLFLFTPLAGEPSSDSESKFFARRYLTEQQALNLQKNAGDRVVEETVVLSDTEVQQIRRRQRVRMFDNTYRIHKIFRSGEDQPHRFAVHIKQPGQHEFMDLMYGVNADGTVHRIDLMVYREPHGGEVKGRRFMRQFKGRSLESSQFRVNMDIIHIAGATISSKSVARGTRKVLALLKQQGFTH